MECESLDSLVFHKDKSLELPIFFFLHYFIPIISLESLYKFELHIVISLYLLMNFSSAYILYYQGPRYWPLEASDALTFGL